MEKSAIVTVFFIGAVREIKSGIFKIHLNFTNSLCIVIQLAAGIHEVRPLWHKHWHT